MKKPEIVPRYLTRYCMEPGNPFISLNELSLTEGNAVKKAHCEKYNIGGFYAEDDYLMHRKEIEKWMYSRLLLKGGRPKCETPVYMFLGDAPVGEYDIRAEIQQGAMGYRIDLDQLDADTVSFAYPDSMYEMDYDENGMPVDGHRTNTPRVMMYGELEEFILKHNVLKNHKFSIEAQVWDRDRLREIWEKKEFRLV
jgi:hypothetical protein